MLVFKNIWLIYLVFKEVIILCGTSAVTTYNNQDHHISNVEKSQIDIANITFTFDCSKRSIGFYADIQYNCQIFHMCDQKGNRLPHMCANETSFNQEYRICDWDYNFNCTESEKWYYLNELTYATDSPDINDETISPNFYYEDEQGAIDDVDYDVNETHY